MRAARQQGSMNGTSPPIETFQRPLPARYVKEKFIAGAAGLDRKSLNNLLATRDGVKIQGFGIPGFS
jgi:hypothetical protein